MESKQIVTDVIKGTSSFSIYSVFEIIAAPISLFLITLYLPPYEYGLIAIAITFGNILNVVTHAGMPAALFRFTSTSIANDQKFLTKKYILTALKIKISTTLPCVVIFSLIAPFLAINVFQKPDLTIFLELFLITSLIGVADQFWLILYGLKKYEYYSFARIFSLILKIGMFLIFLPLYGAIGYTVSYLAAMLSATLLKIGFLRNDLKDIFRSRHAELKETSLNITKEMLRYGISAGSASILFFIHGNALVILMAFFLTSIEIGYYAFSYALVSMIKVLIGHFVTSISPILYAVYDQDKKRASNIIHATSRLMLSVIIPLTLFSMFIIYDFIDLFFSDAYLPSATVFQVLVALILIYPWFYLADLALQCTKRMELITLRNFTMLTFLVVLSFIIIPLFRLLGAVLVILASNSIGAVIGGILIRKQEKGLFRVKIGHFLTPAIASIPTIIFLYFMRRWIFSILSFIVVTVIGLIIMFFSLIFFKVIRISDLEFIETVFEGQISQRIKPLITFTKYIINSIYRETE
jgi:O-antigen/teichoic acid export membrane protein